MNTVDEILDYAIDQEQQAADFYADLARRAEKAGMKEILLDFSAEEQSHKDRLLAVKAGERELTPEQEVLDLKISDYLVEVDASTDISYQDALIVAMKRERAAFQLQRERPLEVSGDLRPPPRRDPGDRERRDRRTGLGRAYRRLRVSG
mgnify:CR=1 FL=1